MSSAQTPQTNEPQQGVRQILDELDALMERMMALPVHEPNETSPMVSVEEPPETETETHMRDEVDETAEPADPPRTYSYPMHESENETPQILAQGAAETDKETESSSNDPDEFANLVPPPINTEAIAESEVEEPLAKLKKSGWRPLLKINQAFDKATQWMGTLGIWLRGKWGRAFIGLIGLGLFAAAIFWGVTLWVL